jgi:pyrroloquinoline-quinone synthase
MSVTAESATQEAVRGTLSVDDTLDEVKKLLEQYAWANHPMWKSLIEGTVNIEQLREWVRQYGVFALHNHGYHGPLYVNCPDPKMRAMLAEVVYEEGTGLLYSNGKPHNEIWCQFGEAIGLTREEMWGAELCSGARALKAFLNDRCNNSFIEGVSALMLAGEAQVPGFFDKLAKSLKKTFNLTDQDVEFFTIHDVADEDHSGAGREILVQFAPSVEDRRLVLETVRAYLGIEDAMQTQIYERMMAAG